MSWEVRGRTHYRSAQGNIAGADVVWSATGVDVGTLTPVPFRDKLNRLAPAGRVVIQNLSTTDNVLVEVGMRTRPAGVRGRITVPALTTFDTGDMLRGITELFFTTPGGAVDVEVLEWPEVQGESEE